MTVDETLEMLEIWARLNPQHREQLFIIAQEFAEWEGRYEYGG